MSKEITVGELISKLKKYPNDLWFSFQTPEN